MEDKVKEYETRLRQRVGEGEYERHQRDCYFVGKKSCN